LKCRHVHDRRDEATRVSTPSLATSNRATPIVTNRAVVAADHKATASGEDILKRISAVSAQFQDAAVVTQVRILIRSFQIEVVSEC
jgi:hypothetical protein